MRVIVAGDFSPYDRVSALIASSEYQSVFGAVRPIIGASDYAVANFETVVESASGGRIRKLGPHLHCPPQSVDALKQAGFDCVSLANNHFYDFGDGGVEASLRRFDEVGLDHVGGGMNIAQASSTLYKRIGDSTLAVINCCEHEFSIATESSAGCNPLDPPVQCDAIAGAREKSDHVIVIVHGGSEYYRYPTPRMVRLYRSFIDAGADAVVNHHQHCFSGYEFYKGRPVVYGLGNFCFDWPGERDGDWNRGYMAALDFNAGLVSLELLPYVQCSRAAVVEPLDDRSAFLSEIKSINEVIADPSALQEHFESLARERAHIYRKIFRPAIFCHNKALKTWNFRTCESHADLLEVVERLYSHRRCDHK